MLDYDKLAAAGHDLTLLCGIRAGISTYFCENCGAVVQNGFDDEPALFHAARFSTSTEDACIAKGCHDVLFAARCHRQLEEWAPLVSLADKIKMRDLRRLERCTDQD